MFNLELIYNKTVETEYLDSNRLWNILSVNLNKCF